MRLGIDIGGTKTAVVILADTAGDRASASHAFPNGPSLNGASQNGASPNGTSPDGASPNTASVMVPSAGSASPALAAVEVLRTAPSGRGPREVVAVAHRLAVEAAALCGGLEAITTMGACMPGLVDPGSGTVRHAVHLEVEALDLGRVLGDMLGRPVTVENDVKAAAIGASRLLGARHDDPHFRRRLAYLNLGTGLASAVVADGSVVRGLHGAAGEIGHLPVGGDVPCSCGQVGCLETVASGSALARMWPVAERLADSPFVASEAGDRAATAAVETLCRGVGLAIQLLVLASGAEHVVIGGGLASLGAPLHDGIRADLQRRARSTRVVDLLDLPDRFELLPSGVPVAALGAAWLAADAMGTVPAADAVPGADLATPSTPALAAGPSTPASQAEAMLSGNDERAS